MTGPIRGRRDGILAATALRDKPGETTRGDGLRAAWQRARTDATAGESLGFRLLQEWQRLVLGLPEVPFRTLPAFAKEGRERPDEVGPIQIRRYADDPVGALSPARIVHTVAVAAERRNRRFEDG
ncbi:hypothetical protein [Streptomyces sp. LaBMicrA B280]|uniref:hypothetical protein n=1 Tax=Streptomyces sp. LaBMicrA B280 TaxID=3391001 RepID=UPI003BA80F58